MVATENSKPRKRIWQYAFVIGLAACIVAGIVVFGMSSFTTIITVFGIIVGLFNAFLGSSRGSDEGNWFLARIKHTLDVNNFLRVATVVIWVAAIGVVAYGVQHYFHEAQKFTLAGRVLTAGGDPAASAHVTLLTQAKKEAITNADGTFAFVEIDPSQEPLKEVKIRVEWKNRILEQPVNLAIDRSLSLQFPAGEPPFRVSYITLEGAAIDLFLRGQIDKRADERLSGQLFIVQNSVFNSLKNLTKKFSIRMDAWEGQSFSVRNDSGEREDESLVAKSVGKPFFVGSSGSIDRPASREDLLSLTDPGQPWSIEIHDADAEDVLSSLGFWRFAKREDLNQFQGERAAFYQYVTRTSMPADFCLVTVGFHSCAESGSVDLVAPMLKLRVAVLENVSSEPIRIGQFLAHEFKDEILRPRDEEEGALKALKAEQQSLFPLETLGPHERLVIPLDMPMAYPENEETSTPSSSTLNGVRRKLAASPVVTIPAGESGESFDLDSGRLLALLNKPPQSQMRDKEYVFGPSMSIESVIVDRVSYPFRQFDVSKLVITSGGAQIGSCPFVYTYSERGTWENEGHILYGRNGVLKESTDEKQLKRFDGRLIIKEEDPEESFIDFVYIKAKLLDGRERLLYPLNQTLRFQDGNYLTMKQGQQIELQFEKPSDLFISSYSIVSRGYYVPYARNLNSGKIGTSQRIFP